MKDAQETNGFLCYKDAQTNSLCYKDAQANSLCYRCKYILGFYYNSIAEAVGVVNGNWTEASRPTKEGLTNFDGRYTLNGMETATTDRARGIIVGITGGSLAARRLSQNCLQKKGRFRSMLMKSDTNSSRRTVRLLTN